jgi:hypothetical protein
LGRPKKTYHTLWRTVGTGLTVIGRCPVVIGTFGPLDWHRIALIQPARKVNLLAPIAAKRHRLRSLRIEVLFADGATNSGHENERKLNFI